MGNRSKTILLLWLPVALWCGLIFFLSSIPDLRIPALGVWDFIFRKIAHFIEYAALTILIYRALNGTSSSGMNLLA